MPYFLIAVAKRLSNLGCLGFVLLHIWTIVLAYKVSGGSSAALSAVLVGIAELYWAVVFWQRAGPLNAYTLAVGAVLVLFAIGALLAQVAEKKALAAILSKKGPGA